MASIVQFRDLPTLAATRLGESEWHQIDQARVDLFADATDDHQWIHVDPQRAATGPFGGTIAHGYLTLALGSALLSEILTVEGADQVLNYGLGKVRFPAPVRVGQRLRLSAECLSVTEVTGGYQVVLVASFELEGQAKPACVAEIVFRYMTTNTCAIIDDAEPRAQGTPTAVRGSPIRNGASDGRRGAES